MSVERVRAALNVCGEPPKQQPAACAPQTSQRARKGCSTFGRERRLCRNPTPLRARRRTHESRLLDLAEHYRLPLLATNGVQYATPLAARCSMFSPASASTPISMPPGNCLTQNAERHLKSDSRNARTLSRSPGRDRKHRAPGRATRVFPRKHRLRISRFSGAGRAFDMDSFLRTIMLFGAQQRYAAISTKVQRQLKEELASSSEARVRRLFSDRLGHR